MKNNCSIQFFEDTKSSMALLEENPKNYETIYSFLCLFPRTGSCIRIVCAEGYSQCGGTE